MDPIKHFQIIDVPIDQLKVVVELCVLNVLARALLMDHLYKSIDLLLLRHDTFIGLLAALDDMLDQLVQFALERVSLLLQAIRPVGCLRHLLLDLVGLAEQAVRGVVVEQMGVVLKVCHLHLVNLVD